jgi:hypothetical protein
MVALGIFGSTILIKLSLSKREEIRDNRIQTQNSERE